jgi:transposase-like protein
MKGSGADIASIADRSQFETDEQCLRHLEKIRWPDGVACPNCRARKISRIHTKNRAGKPRGIYQCLDKNCRYQFSATTGTIFHDSHLPLNKWFTAVALISGSNGTISANQLRLALDVQYKTAQRIYERVREALQAGTIEQRLLDAPKPAPKMTPAAAPKRPEPKPHSIVPPLHKPAGIDTVPQHLAAAGEAAIGDALTMAASLARVTMRSPFIFAKYLIDKI